MNERLAISDLVLADVSIPNGNVYYESGIRHAAQKARLHHDRGYLLENLFDIDQMRHIRYPLPAESISDETDAKIIKIVASAIPLMAASDSPFYQVFPDFPNSIRPTPRLSRKALKSPGFKRKSSLPFLQLEINALPALLTFATATPLEGRFRKLWPFELPYTLRDCTNWITTLDFVDKLPANLMA
jgi:hypothetical protein